MSVPQFSMRELLEAGVHYGHKTRRWNPKMSEYIYGEKDGIHIINLQKTVPLLHQALKKVHDVVAKNGRVIFVGTKPQAQEPIAEAAKRCGQHFINNRWLGGTLTNWNTISNSIRTLRRYDEVLNDATAGITKKEKLEISRKKDRLERSIGGIKDIGGLPDLIIVIDTRKEELALQEAKKLGIPVIAIVDSNCDPDGIEFVIPGNDDSIRAIKLYCRLFSDAVLAGIKDSLGAAGVDFGAAVEPAKPELPEAKEEAKDEKKGKGKRHERPEAAKVETVVKKSRAIKKPKAESEGAEDGEQGHSEDAEAAAEMKVEKVHEKLDDKKAKKQIKKGGE